DDRDKLRARQRRTSRRSVARDAAEEWARGVQPGRLGVALVRRHRADARIRRAADANYGLVAGVLNHLSGALDVGHPEAVDRKQLDAAPQDFIAALGGCEPERAHREVARRPQGL